MDDVMTVEQFKPCEGSVFTVVGVEPRLALSLTDVASLHRDDAAARAGFSLVFESTDPRVLEQRLHRLQHGSMGEIALFLVPIGRGTEGMAYQAIFT